MDSIWSIQAKETIAVAVVNLAQKEKGVDSKNQAASIAKQLHRNPWPASRNRAPAREARRILVRLLNEIELQEMARTIELQSCHEYREDSFLHTDEKRW